MAVMSTKSDILRISRIYCSQFFIHKIRCSQRNCFHVRCAYMRLSVRVSKIFYVDRQIQRNVKDHKKNRFFFLLNKIHIDFRSKYSFQYSFLSPYIRLRFLIASRFFLFRHSINSVLRLKIFV